MGDTPSTPRPDGPTPPNDPSDANPDDVSDAGPSGEDLPEDAVSGDDLEGDRLEGDDLEGDDLTSGALREDAADEDAGTSTDPESARQAAEDALAEVESLAGLDADALSGDGSPDSDPASATGTRAEDEQAEHAPEDDTPEEDAQADGELVDQCPNCGALLEGPYCSQCGQKATGRIKPLWHMMNEVFEAVFELDLRVLHTLPKFLFRPGKLTQEYIDGRRRRYIRPFRLYLFATFLLFTTLAFLRPSDSPLSVFTTPDALVPPSAADSVAAQASERMQSGFFSQIASAPAAQRLQLPPEVAGALPDSLLNRLRTSDSLRVDRLKKWLDSHSASVDSTALDSSVFAQIEQVQRYQSAREEEENVFGSREEREKIAQSIRESTDFNLRMTDDSLANARLSRVVQEKTARAVEDPSQFVGALIDRMPYMMFLMLPVFAFLLKLLYVRQGRLYMEHLIFTLHVHALTFFAFTAGALMEEWGTPWVQEAGVWVLASPLLYLILAMKTVYRQGFFTSCIKALVLFTTYVTILLVALTLLAIITVLFL